MLKVSHVVQDLLALFSDYEIHATWAIVGLLGYTSKEQLQDDLGNSKIPYANQKYSPYPLANHKYDNIPFDIIGAKSEIERILSTNNQELASHTFSHYYCLEDGQSEKNFKEDLNRMKLIGEKFSHQFKSIIFPRNQINQNYLKTCFNEGYSAYRGNQKNKLWSNSPYEKESITKRGKRYLDAYYSISSTESTKVDELEVNNGMINIPGSRFFRPFSNRARLEKKKLERIKLEMESAAKNNEVYHLWWHPHNFSRNTDENIQQIKELFEWYLILNKKYHFESLNMGEITDYAKK